MRYLDVSNLGQKMFLNEKINQDFYIKIFTKTKQYDYVAKSLKIETKNCRDFTDKENVKVYTKTNISFYVESFNHSFMNKDDEDFSTTIKIHTEKGCFHLVDFDLKHYPPPFPKNYRLIDFEVDSRIGEVILIKTI